MISCLSSQETIYKNYFRIQLKPEQFSSYLMSPEVGFSSYELVATPHNTSKGKVGSFELGEAGPG